jgi:hypothetical protein
VKIHSKMSLDELAALLGDTDLDTVRKVRDELVKQFGGKNIEDVDADAVTGIYVTAVDTKPPESLDTDAKTEELVFKTDRIDARRRLAELAVGSSVVYQMPAGDMYEFLTMAPHDTEYQLLFTVDKPNAIGSTSIKVPRSLAMDAVKEIGARATELRCRVTARKDYRRIGYTTYIIQLI